MSLKSRGYRGLVWLRRISIPWSMQWIGALLVGLLAALMAWSSDAAWHVFRGIAGNSTVYSLLITPAGFVLALWLCRRFFQGSEGSGIPQVIAATARHEESHNREWLGWRAMAGKLLLCPLVLLCGGSIGREGPTVQVGAAAMNLLSSAFRGINQRQKRAMILAGGAAGVAAAFNTPLAGVVFAIEELSQSFEQRTSGTIILAVVFAGVVTLAIFGNYTYFGQVAPTAATVPFTAIIACGIVGGVGGGLFSRAVLSLYTGSSGRVIDFRRRHPIRFAALCGLAVALMGIVSGGSIFGTGYEQSARLLAGEIDTPPGYGLLKLSATFASFASGVPAGIFAPSLAVGAGLGADLVRLLSIDSGAEFIVLLCMASYLAGVTQAPLTTFVIVMEMTGGHSIVLALMLCALIGARISHLFCRRLYDALAEAMAAGRPVDEEDKVTERPPALDSSPGDEREPPLLPRS